MTPPGARPGRLSGMTISSISTPASALTIAAISSGLGARLAAPSWPALRSSPARSSFLSATRPKLTWSGSAIEFTPRTVSSASRPSTTPSRRTDATSTPLAPSRKARLRISRRPSRMPSSVAATTGRTSLAGGTALGGPLPASTRASSRCQSIARLTSRSSIATASIRTVLAPATAISVPVNSTRRTVMRSPGNSGTPASTSSPILIGGATLRSAGRAMSLIRTVRVHGSNRTRPWVAGPRRRAQRGEGRLDLALDPVAQPLGARIGRGGEDDDGRADADEHLAYWISCPGPPPKHILTLW